MKKQVLVVLFIFVLVLGFSFQTHAELIVRGTDSLGYQLIYDTDLNITWYDYTMYDSIKPGNNNWFNQWVWASSLSVSGGDLVGVYDDWRLPSTVDGHYVWGYDGTTTAGYNITSSEMGHLFYTELGNKGWYDTSGNLTGCSSSSPYCLTKTGDFQKLRPGLYWSGTEYAADTDGAWLFDVYVGGQYYGGKINEFYYGIAVRPGDVSVVPEPISTILFLTGGATLIGRKYLRNKR